MFENIGGKIKGFAKFVCWLGIIGSIILGVLSNVDGGPLLGILVAITGSIASWVGSFLTYGFGQLVENSDTLVKQNNELLNSKLFRHASRQGSNLLFDWHSVNESVAVRVSETNIQCTNCHQVQFKGNETCTQCGAKFTEIVNNDTLAKQSNAPMSHKPLENISVPKGGQVDKAFVWHPVSETEAVKVSETNIKCENCHQVQFKGNKTCTQCGAKFTVIINNDIEKA